MIANGRKALLIVDVQNDFISGSLALNSCPAKEEGADVVPIINEKILGQADLYKEWDIIVYTQDWHPDNHCSFIENVADDRFSSDITSRRIQNIKVFDTIDLTYPSLNQTFKQKLWPKHCVENTWGAQIHADLIIPCCKDNLKEVYMLHKGQDPNIDCYSAFWSTDWLFPTGLDQKLKSFYIDTVYVCGLALDICVFHTAMDATRLGYKTFLVRDACRGVSHEGIEKALQDMNQLGILQIDSNDVNIYISVMHHFYTNYSFGYQRVM